MNESAAKRHDAETVSRDAPSGRRRVDFRPSTSRECGRGPLAGGGSLVRERALVGSWMFSLLDESSSPLFTYRTRGN
jgi:hypothetical protein